MAAAMVLLMSAVRDVQQLLMLILKLDVACSSGGGSWEL